ncbi:MAG: LuxR family transcriptional regulator, partial [Verrucomicrobiaceae bacterium]
VLNWIHAGKNDAEISLILGCAVRTVEKHVANLYRKLKVTSRSAVILHTPNPQS